MAVKPVGEALVLVSMTAASALVAASLYVVPVLAPIMAPAFGTSSLTVGHYVALIYVGSIFGGALAGDLVMRYGPVRVHQASLLACALGMLLMLGASIPLAVASAVLVGAGSGATTPAASQMLRRTTPADRMNFAFSIRQTGLPLGGALIGVLAPMLEARLDWQSVLLGLALLSLPFMVLLQPLRPSLDDERQAEHRFSLVALTGIPAAVRAAPGVGGLAMVSLALAAAQISLTSFFVTYLHERLGYSLLAAGSLLSVAHLSGIVSRLAWGYAADRWFGAARALRWLAVASGVALILLGSVRPGTEALVLTALTVALGALGMGWNGMFLSELARRAPPGNAARTTSAVLPLTFGGALVGPPLFSVVAEATGSYGAAFIAIALMPLAAGAVMFYRRTGLR